jgi:hypothetical protein
LKPFIHTIELHYSNRCTGDCIVCSKAHGRNKEPFCSYEVVDATVENLKDIDFNWLQVGGDGDSFLNKEVFFYALRRFRKEFPDKGICLFSNASLLTPENTDILVGEKLLDDIQTRIDSLNPILYKQSTGLKLEKVLDNIKYFFVRNDFIRFHVIYFPLYGYKDFCQGLLGKRPTHWHRIDEALLRNEEQDMRTFFYSLPRNEGMVNRLGFRVSQLCFWGEREDVTPRSAVCTQLNAAFVNQTYIYPDGDIGLCPYDDGQDTFVLGNILRGDKIKDIWDSDLRKQFIKDISEGKYCGTYPCTDPVACGMYNHSGKIPGFAYGKGTNKHNVRMEDGL